MALIYPLQYVDLDPHTKQSFLKQYVVEQVRGHDVIYNHRNRAFRPRGSKASHRAFYQIALNLRRTLSKKLHGKWVLWKFLKMTRTWVIRGVGVNKTGFVSFFEYTQLSVNKSSDIALQNISLTIFPKCTNSAVFRKHLIIKIFATFANIRKKCSTSAIILSSQKMAALIILWQYRKYWPIFEWVHSKEGSKSNLARFSKIC